MGFHMKLNVCWVFMGENETGPVFWFKATSYLDLLTLAVNIKTVFTINFLTEFSFF